MHVFFLCPWNNPHSEIPVSFVFGARMLMTSRHVFGAKYQSVCFWRESVNDTWRYVFGARREIIKATQVINN